VSGIQSATFYQTDGEGECHLGVISKHAEGSPFGTEKSVHPPIPTLNLGAMSAFEVGPENISSGTAEKTTYATVFVNRSPHCCTERGEWLRPARPTNSI
jgi:hypothetical protein